MTNYDTSDKEKAENAGKELANKHLDMVKKTLNETEICPKGSGSDKKVSDMVKSELFELIIKAIKECKRQDAEDAY